jgi:D-beta-D-heptose 7-phosphate kinase/D-beta-D-heptose 1-phosphate adenosyltransferase
VHRRAATAVDHSVRLREGCHRAARIRQAIALASAQGIPVLVDPKGPTIPSTTGPTTVTPNAAELALMSSCSEDDGSALMLAARRLGEQLSLKFVTCTRGEHGI